MVIQRKGGGYSQEGETNVIGEMEKCNPMRELAEFPDKYQPVNKT